MSSITNSASSHLARHLSSEIQYGIAISPNRRHKLGLSTSCLLKHPLPMLQFPTECEADSKAPERDNFWTFVGVFSTILKQVPGWHEPLALSPNILGYRCCFVNTFFIHRTVLPHFLISFLYGCPFTPKHRLNPTYVTDEFLSRSSQDGHALTELTSTDDKE